MSVVSVPQFWTPVPVQPTGTALAFVASNLNGGVTQKTGSRFQVSKPGNIHKIHFRTGTVTTPTDMDIRVETVGSDGYPTGTLWGTNTNFVLTSGSIAANTWITVTLTADAAVNQGDDIAIVFFPAGTPSFQLLAIGTGFGMGYPSRVSFNNNTTTWTSVTSAIVLGIEYSDGTFAYIPDAVPATAVNTHTISTSTTPDEVALKFRFPIGVRVAGAWSWQTRAAAATYKATLYDSDGTTVLGASPATVGGPTNSQVRSVLFPSSISLLANTNYFLSIKPQSTTSLDLYSIDVNVANLLDEMEGGQNFHYRDAKSGTWNAAVTTRRPFIGLILDGIDGGSSPGGSPIIGSAIVRAA